MALNAGMKYVNITARHHDSFCLFDSAVSDYTSVKSPAGRDLVAELAEQCGKKNLGLFLYYSYALDWRHPYFYPRSYNPIARPDYGNPEEVYKWRSNEDFAKYLEFVHAQLKELLNNYGPLAGIWFDPIMGYYARPDLFPIHETYDMIRKLQPRVWGYKKDDDGDHLNAEQVLTRLNNANQNNMNLLMNTGPLPDGSIHETDVATLAEVGKSGAFR